MVFDKWKMRPGTFAPHPRLAKAFDYLRTTDLSQLSLGRHDIVGDEVFALVQEYRTARIAKDFGNRIAAYIDVQHVASGAERMG